MILPISASQVARITGAWSLPILKSGYSFSYCWFCVPYWDLQFFFFFLVLGFELGHHACLAGTLPLEPLHQQPLLC
jgi:hypothetical protein